jgi:hypothetical protein
MVFLTCCPEDDVGFERKFHCGADGKPTPLLRSARKLQEPVACVAKNALSAPAPSAAAKAPVVLYFCAACASIFSITMALEPPRL